MWRGRELQVMLPLVDQNPYITEIRLINNDNSKTPDWFQNTEWKKVKIADFDKNVYVNPAWDFGIRNSKTDTICLMSDDICFDTRVFDFLKDKMGPEQGIIGPDSTSFFRRVMGNEISITLRENESHNIGYGTLMFLNKKNYVPFPEQIKIFYGDTWLYMTSVVLGKTPRKLTNFRMDSKLDTTSGDKKFSNLVASEHHWWKSNITDWKSISDLVNQRKN